MDLFVVPTVSFRLLYGLLILKHCRREILHLAATTHPSAEWISRQLTEAYGMLSGARSGWRIRRGIHLAPSRNGNSGPADRTTVAMAELLVAVDAASLVAYGLT
jgi:hypothetical protein